MGFFYSVHAPDCHSQSEKLCVFLQQNPFFHWMKSAVFKITCSCFVDSMFEICYRIQIFKMNALCMTHCG